MQNRSLKIAKRKANAALKKARAQYERAKKKPPGEGSRFKAVAAAARASGAKNPEAVAAKAMWKKYRKKGGARLIKKGKAAKKRKRRK